MTFTAFASLRTHTINNGKWAWTALILLLGFVPIIVNIVSLSLLMYDAAYLTCSRSFSSRLWCLPFLARWLVAPTKSPAGCFPKAVICGQSELLPSSLLLRVLTSVM